MTTAVGIDFGTTNSALAVARGAGESTLATFADGDRETTAFRSILYFDPEGRSLGGRAKAVAGPAAIRRYLESETKGRLIQSIKSYLPSRLFTQTQIYNHTYGIEDLIATILRQMRAAAEAQFGNLGRKAVVGRPVRFAGAATEEDEEFALSRLGAAIEEAGFDEITFEFEPVAAAYEYDTRLDHDELVLIGDFGGGTSDFTLVRLGPSSRGAGRKAIIGSDGVGVAGDVFDSRIVRHLAAPAFGLGSHYRSLGQVLEMPAWIYRNLERWHYVSFLKNKKTTDKLRQLRTQALEPEKVGALLHLVENDLGFELHRSVEALKFELSAGEEGSFSFDEPPVRIAAEVAREEFEDWVHEDVRAIAACVDGLLSRCGVSARDVDSVFLTGGSSFVPIVRRFFERRFGADRMRGGGELTTVAKGLALRAAADG
jgi:hypothetical chaperone protein